MTINYKGIKQIAKDVISNASRKIANTISKTPYPLAFSTWDDKEIEAIQSVIETDMYTMGKHVKQFEQEFAEKFGSQHAIMVNSGSSANLLMLSLLKHMEHRCDKDKRRNNTRDLCHNASKPFG